MFTISSDLQYFDLYSLILRKVKQNLVSIYYIVQYGPL